MPKKNEVLYFKEDHSFINALAIMDTVYFGTVRSRTAILVDAIQLPEGRTHAQIKAEKRTLKAKKTTRKKTQTA